MNTSITAEIPASAALLFPMLLIPFVALILLIDGNQAGYFIKGKAIFRNSLNSIFIIMMACFYIEQMVIKIEYSYPRKIKELKFNC